MMIKQFEGFKGHLVIYRRHNYKLFYGKDCLVNNPLTWTQQLCSTSFYAFCLNQIVNIYLLKSKVFQNDE